MDSYKYLTRSQLGQQAEVMASQFLTQQGLILLRRNYHCLYGEIDLIMQDEQDIVFIEVRYRQSQQYMHVLESIDGHKQIKLVKTALYFLTTHKCSRMNCRFDVVGCALIKQGAPVQWIKNAFMINI